MSEQFKLPPRGFVFWPVGTGDSTTIVIKTGVVMQLDLHHLAKADEDDDPAWPIVDQLVRLLPKKNGKPYLSLFALTHPDEDHILGFKELLKQVTIGEIWHTPRIFRDWVDENQLCEDAEAFYQEVHRRRKAIIKNPDEVPAGDRVLVIGHDDILSEDKYKRFPKDRTSRPGDSITVIDDEDLADVLNIFVHAPFKVDAEDTRNNTSLSLHIRLIEGEGKGEALFFGDREYPTLKQIFEVTEAHDGNEEFLLWDVLLSPHHCSKKAMFWKDEGEEDEEFKEDIMDYFEAYRKDNGYIITSANADFRDEEGDNPPHGKARKKYEAIVEAGSFICTHEHLDEDSPEPIVFEMTAEGLTKLEPSGDLKKGGLAAVTSAVSGGRGTVSPPGQQVGFGQCHD